MGSINSTSPSDSCSCSTWPVPIQWCSEEVSEGSDVELALSTSGTSRKREIKTAGVSVRLPYILRTHPSHHYPHLIFHCCNPVPWFTSLSNRPPYVSSWMKFALAIQCMHSATLLKFGVIIGMDMRQQAKHERAMSESRRC